MCNAVHRLVEEQAARRPDTIAVSDGACTLTYRDLNLRANTLARRLSASGLTRGSLAFVRVPRSTELALVLLAVLKAGAAYAWIEPGSREDIDLPAPFCIGNHAPCAERRLRAVDISAALRESVSRPTANLPVLTRGTDIACVLLDRHGEPDVLVPHATIAALPRVAAPRSDSCGHTAGAFDLWLGLMTGATMEIGAAAPASAAA